MNLTFPNGSTWAGPHIPTTDDENRYRFQNIVGFLEYHTMYKARKLSIQTKCISLLAHSERVVRLVVPNFTVRDSSCSDPACCWLYVDSYSSLVSTFKSMYSSERKLLSNLVSFMCILVHNILLSRKYFWIYYIISICALKAAPCFLGIILNIIVVNDVEQAKLIVIQ